MKPWLSVVGIGEDGQEGLSPAARALIDTAEVLVGGERHLSKVSGEGAEHITWGEGFPKTLGRIAAMRGRRVTVLASGDPFCYGVGAVLARRFDIAEMTVIPAPGAFSLACARMGWSLPDVETLTLHGRPLETLNFFLTPNARLLVLSRDGETPGKVAELLRGRGFGPSRLTVFEHMGGADERRLEGVAEDWGHPGAADLNTIAIECAAGGEARWLPRVPGLPDDAFEHDGQITKREVRAVTLARLMPAPRQRLWDLGAGSGSVAIEWLRAEPTTEAIAVERVAARCAAIARNGAALGVPRLEVTRGEAPGALEGLEPRPDAIFLGGGVSTPGLLEFCWQALGGGGRLVANAVTIEAEALLLAFHEARGGDLVRLGVARAEPMGRLSGFKPMMEITQLAAVKP
ncbi:MAG: precorrin-6y C5,15-methyltransferase (decarboxylating) subunit CbiE [Rhodospirillales bacterium]